MKLLDLDFWWERVDLLKNDMIYSKKYKKEFIISKIKYILFRNNKKIIIKIKRKQYSK